MQVCTLDFMTGAIARSWLYIPCQCTFLVIVSATQSRFYFMPVHFYILLGVHLFIQIAHSTCFFNTSMTFATRGAGTSEFTPVHLLGLCCSIFSLLRNLPLFIPILYSTWLLRCVVYPIITAQGEVYSIQ
jgi:uncharacterized membrane protein